MNQFLDYCLPLKQGDAVTIKGDDSGLVFVIDVLINREALLKYKTKNGFFKMAHWQSCSALQRMN